ncbi:MAG: hypothetical protein DRP46_08845 [Candidatus Zixiibacteriota bacterium]|nr:MAG: hypothetical protein DRP46_08845 [candidate division Zixibacteria bacterium]
MFKAGQSGLFFLFLLVFTAMSIISCSSDDNDSIVNTPTNPGGGDNNGGGTVTNRVSITNFTFSPSNITVRAGAMVTWENLDEVRHTIRSDNGAFAGSGDLLQDDTYSVTFNTVGTYPYHCSIHPSMTGTVTVVP